jgi:hypothetical protein
MKYCFNCRYELMGMERFCAQCGQNLEIQGLTRKTLEEVPLNLEFTSRLLLGGSLIRPDRLRIEPKNVVYEKRNKYLIGVDKTIIPISRLASVEIDRKLISCNINLYSKGQQTIVLKNFSIGDARQIKLAIEERME